MLFNAISTIKRYFPQNERVLCCLSNPPALHCLPTDGISAPAYPPTRLHPCCLFSPSCYLGFHLAKVAENARLAKRLETVTLERLKDRLQYKERDFIDENRVLRAELACYSKDAKAISIWLCTHGVQPVGGPYCGFENTNGICINGRCI